MQTFDATTFDATFSKSGKVAMGHLLVFLFPFLVAVNGGLYLTKHRYDGNISYAGWFDACQNELGPRAEPATAYWLTIDHFWNTKFGQSWVMDIEINCLGYIYNKNDVMGTCIETPDLLYITSCSCDMKLPLVCHILYGMNV